MEALTTTQADRRLVNIFYSYFEVIPACTPELLKAAYHLRYQVFCIETGFEDPNQFPAKLETDEFDKHATHSLLKYQLTGELAGTVRLILPRTDVEGCFPIHGITHHPLFFNERRFPRSKVAEVSRLAISKAFRRRRGEFASPNAATLDYYATSRNERRVIPHIILGLVAGLVRMSAENGIQHWFCAVEPSLLRLLSRHGLYLMPCGPMVKYHGERQPCYAHLDQFLGTARERRPDVWELITQEGKVCP